MSDREPVNHEDARRAILLSLSMWNALADTATANRIAAIEMAFDFGATWVDVGKAIGMTRQAAQKKYQSLVRNPPRRRTSKPTS